MADVVDRSLMSVLGNIRQRIKQIRDRKESIGEQNTKAILIEPLLSALGWNMTDWDEVCREYKSRPQDNPVDYALMIHRTPRLFVEAKDLRGHLNERKWISQVVSYATVVGVKWCVLTNGDEYRLYNSHAPVDVEEKLFRTIRISDESQEAYALQTLDLVSKDKMAEDLIGTYWREHFVDRQVEAALYDLLQNDDANLIRLIRKQSPDLRPSEIRESIERAEIIISFPTSSLPTSPKAVTPEPVETISESEAEPLHDTAGIEIADIVRAGLVETPLKLEKEFKRREFTAVLQPDGKILFDGRIYNSPSISASMARKAVIGAPPGRAYPHTNGWFFWKYRDPKTGKLEYLDKLRREYAEKIGR